jgi:hypothetical protein
LRLTGIHDRDKFKALDWGLRTWDQWQFNDCDDRFGSDWPGRIPAQLVAHTLYYFSRPGDRVLGTIGRTLLIAPGLKGDRITGNSGGCLILGPKISEPVGRCEKRQAAKSGSVSAKKRSIPRRIQCIINQSYVLLVLFW